MSFVFHGESEAYFVRVGEGRLGCAVLDTQESALLVGRSCFFQGQCRVCRRSEGHCANQWRPRFRSAQLHRSGTDAVDEAPSAFEARPASIKTSPGSADLHRRRLAFRWHGMSRGSANIGGRAEKKQSKFDPRRRKRAASAGGHNGQDRRSRTRLAGPAAHVAMPCTRRLTGTFGKTYDSCRISALPHCAKDPRIGFSRRASGEHYLRCAIRADHASGGETRKRVRAPGDDGMGPGHAWSGGGDARETY